MKKILTTLVLSIFIFSACDTEKKVQRSDKYNYHEIVECTIPVSKRFDRLFGTPKHPYNRAYGHIISEEKAEVNTFAILKPDKRTLKKFDSYVNNKNMIKIESKYGNFEIYKLELTNPITKKIMLVNYRMLGEKADRKTYISFDAPTKAQGEEELEYLMDYCQQTWKKSKGE